jgi:hypothetical protein
MIKLTGLCSGKSVIGYRCFQRCYRCSKASSMITELRLRSMGHNPQAFPLLSGVLQGSPLSSVLYTLFINDLVRDLNQLKAPPGATRLAGRLFRCLLYADDTVLLPQMKKPFTPLAPTMAYNKSSLKFGIRRLMTSNVGKLRCNCTSLNYFLLSRDA